MRSSRAAVLVVAIALLLPGVHGQNAFEVASVKPSSADAPGPPFELTPGGGLNINTTVKFLVQMAYGVQDYRLAGVPKWLDTEYYRIVAKPPAGSLAAEARQNRTQTEERIRTLLAERFQFAAHHETRTLQEYALVVAKGGPKMKEMAPDAEHFKLTLGKGRISTRGGGAKTAMLANLLANVLQYPVIDETHLDGSYEIQLKYSLEEAPADAAPTLFAALQEQLGLRLEARKGPVDVLVIDRVERPSEN